MATIDVRDAGGNRVPIEKPLAPGRAAAAASRPVALSTEDNALLATLGTETALQAILAALQGVLAVGAVALPLPAGASTEATLAALKTANHADLAALLTGIALGASGNVIGATLDAGPAATTVRGVVAGAPFTSADQSAAAAAVTQAPAAGQRLIVDDLFVSVDTDMAVTFTEETSGAVVHKVYLAANVPWQYTSRAKFELATADKRLMVQTSGAGNIVVQALYHSEA